MLSSNHSSILPMWKLKHRGRKMFYWHHVYCTCPHVALKASFSICTLTPARCFLKQKAFAKSVKGETMTCLPRSAGGLREETKEVVDFGKCLQVFIPLESVTGNDSMSYAPSRMLPHLTDNANLCPGPAMLASHSLYLSLTPSSSDHSRLISDLSFHSHQWHQLTPKQSASSTPQPLTPKPSPQDWKSAQHMSL